MCKSYVQIIYNVLCIICVGSKKTDTSSLYCCRINLHKSVNQFDKSVICKSYVQIIYNIIRIICFYCLPKTSSMSILQSDCRTKTYIGPTTQMGNASHDPRNPRGNTLIAFLSKTQNKIV